MLKKNSFNKSINSIAFFNILAPIILNGIHFLTLPIFTRILSQEDFGIVSIYTTWVGILSIFIALQTHGSIGTAFIHFPKEEHKPYMASILGISSSSFIAVALLVLIFLYPISSFLELEPTLILIMLFHSLGSFGVNFALFKFLFYKEAQKNFILSVIVSVSSTALALVLVFTAKEKLYFSRIIGMAIPNVLVGLFFIVRFITSGRGGPWKKYWRFCLPITIPLVFHNLSHLLLSQGARISIQKIYGFSQVGIYNLVFTFVQILSILYSALNNTWVPFYYDDLKARDRKTIIDKTKNYTVLFTVVTAAFIFASPEVFRIFANEPYWEAIPLIPVMACSVYFTFLYSFPVNFQFYHRKTLGISIGTTLAAFVNLGLVYLFVPLWGLQGAALAMLISYILLFFLHIFIAISVIKSEYYYKLLYIVVGVLSVSVASMLFFILYDLWYIRWFFAVILGVGLLLFIIRNKRLF